MSGEAQRGNEDGRLESSPCSLWQSEQEALSQKSQSIPRRLLLSSRPQHDGSTGGSERAEEHSKEGR